MRSRITKKLIPFGACEDHQSHDDMMETEAQVNHVQTSEATDETLCTVMQNLAIPDVTPINPDEDEQ